MALLEYGKVANLRKNFGFIKCTARRLDLYFHFTALEPSLEPDDVKPGLEVQFVVGQDENGKPCAQQVARAPEGTACFESISTDFTLGKVIKLPAPSRVPSAHVPAHAEQEGLIRHLNRVETCTWVKRPARFLTADNEAVHVTFKSTDVASQQQQSAAQPGESGSQPQSTGSVCQPGDLVFFQICTNIKQAQQSKQTAGARAGQRAVNVQRVAEAAVQWLSEEQQRQRVTLELLEALDS